MSQNQVLNSSEALVEQLSRRDRTIECSGLAGSARAYVTATVRHRYGAPMGVILPSAKQAERFIEDVCFFAPELKSTILYFPPYNILPFKYLAYHSETACNRIRTLYQLLESNTPPLVVTSIDAVMQKIIPREVILQYAELIGEHEELDREMLIHKLIRGGYLRATIVEEPGDFSVRGGIVDVFTPLYKNPLRIEFFGDVVDSIRFFSVVNQRRIENIAEAVVLPAREAVLHKAQLPHIITRIRARANEMDLSVTSVRTIIDHIQRGEGFAGIESLTPLLYPQLDCLFDYLGGDALLMVSDPEELERKAIAFEAQVLQQYRSSCDCGKLCVAPNNLYLQWEQLNTLISEKKPVLFKSLDRLPADHQKSTVALPFRFSITDNSDIRAALAHPKNTEQLFRPFADWLSAQKDAGCVSIVVCPTQAHVERIKSLLAPYKIQFSVMKAFPGTVAVPDPYVLCIGRLSSGFVWKTERLAVITEEEIFGLKRQIGKSRPRPSVSQLLDLEDLKKNDLIVHQDHGIGRYQGLMKLTVDGLTNDFLAIVYKGEDRLFLPVDRMSVVHKYMGVEGVAPDLDKLGGRSWERVKARVKRAAEKIAGELLKLYARRKVETGFAFRHPAADLQDFETGFEYEETADQIKTIDDMLQDLQQPVPMDRLVCGDVGYGKTEVALRASFISVFNGKQTAFLVPTTILAEQHYATFRRRFERQAVNIACLSRFRSAREQRDIVEGLRTGKIDIVIGTHRLLQKDVMFKDLGLLVLDEEQRFGVRHKEKLKRLRSSVDVLTLTATPIPRTLHMSLMGIRDISIISTPPEHRQSIITYVTEFDAAVICEAIRKELQRQGQIFFVYNNIEGIPKMARRLQQMVPECKVGVAHARLPENDLEWVMYQFMTKEIDMLVCTSIIESGLDIPSANTIIVHRADRFGLAQIYQLRGRVGRSDEQAYAYLLIPHESSLTDDAKKRLKVLMEHSDLGSGFQIAMNDLKIRGGGTVLGASQSGHIAAVGYDMFLKLMEEAIAHLKGEPPSDHVEPEINVSISAFLSESYIPDLNQRLSAYRRLAKMIALTDIGEFKTELRDRYGILPSEAKNLLLKIALKVLAKEAGISRIDLNEQYLTVQFAASRQLNSVGLVAMVMAAPERFTLINANRLKIKIHGHTRRGQLLQAKNILKEIAQHVSQ